MKNFVLIGAAGYIAPRHMEAIKSTGNQLVSALDPHDSVGILDQYFPNCDFFTEFERFDRHCEKLRRSGSPIDYVVVCSPNYLHDAHIRFGLRIGADVICEKPLVLNPWNAAALMEMEKETNRRVFVVHQLRHHPALIKLKEKVAAGPADKIYNVDLRYITTRGKWYQYSWKGDINKSGGIVTNIGLHFFDILIWIFGSAAENSVSELTPIKAKGKLVLEKAAVNWMLSTDSNDLKQPGDKISSRRLMVDGEEILLDNNFNTLHTEVYRSILNGNGLGIMDASKSIDLICKIRNETTSTH